MNTIYDTTLQTLQKHFEESKNITEAKANSERDLFLFLQNNPSMENDIRLAILHFYNQCGLGCFIHYKKHQLQIITRIKNYTYNIYIQKISNFLKEHKSTLYTKQPTKADFDELFNFVDSTLDLQNQNIKKDMIKIALRNVFEINIRDALFFKDGSIRFKKFDYEIVQINNEIRHIASKMHMHVLSNEDIKKFELVMSEINIQNLIMQNTLQILKDNINLTKINNILFNQRLVFFATQKLRFFFEKPSLKHIDSIAKNIYCINLIQKYAWVMFEVIAKELLDLCAKNDENAIAFIQFYNGASIELEGKIYIKPLIINKNGQPWTLPLIQDILENKANIELKVQDMQDKASELERNIYNIAKQIKQNEKKLQDSQDKIDSYKNILELKNKELRLLVDKKAPKREIDVLSEKINTLILDKSRILTDIDETQKNIANLNKEYTHLLLSQKELLEQISQSLKKHKEQFLQYDLLLRSLASAIEDGKELK